MVVGRLVSLILAVFLLIAVGALARWAKLLHEEDASRLNQVIIYLALPAFIFRAAREAELSPVLFKIPIVALVVASVMLFLSYIVARLLRLENRSAGSFVMATPAGNTGYLGYPLTHLLFGGPQVVKAIVYDMTGTVLYLFTVGLFIAERYGADERKGSWLTELLTFPPLIILPIGLLLRGVALPTFFTSAVGLLADVTIPLIMISIGLSLRLTRLSGAIAGMAAIAVLKLGVAPVLALVAGSLVALDGPTLRIAVLEASMPIAVVSMVIAARFKLDTDFLAGSILATTLLSAVTIPLWQRVLV